MSENIGTDIAKRDNQNSVRSYQMIACIGDDEEGGACFIEIDALKVSGPPDNPLPIITAPSLKLFVAGPDGLPDTTIPAITIDLASIVRIGLTGVGIEARFRELRWKDPSNGCAWYHAAVLMTEPQLMSLQPA